MNRKQALLCAGALLLTGCEPAKDHYGPDFREAPYIDYLRYSLGEDCQITLDRSRQGPDGEYYSEWTAQYTPEGADAPRELHYTTYDFFTGMVNHPTEQNYNDYQLLHLTVPAAKHAALQDFADRILSKYYFINSFSDVISIPMEQGVNVSCWLYHAPTDAKIPCPAPTARAADPQTGLCVRTAGLQSIAQDESFILCFQTEITSDDADVRHFTEQAEQICADFLRETGAPKNYRFCVTRTREEFGVERTDTLFERTKLEGFGEINAEAQLGGGDSVDLWWNLMNALAEHLNQKYETAPAE